MSRLTREEIENRYKEINEEYNRFSFEITQYGIDPTFKETIKEPASKLRLLLKKFL